MRTRFSLAIAVAFLLGCLVTGGTWWIHHSSESLMRPLAVSPPVALQAAPPPPASTGAAVTAALPAAPASPPPATAAGSATNPPSSPSFVSDDPTAGFPVIATGEESASDSPGSIKRVRIVKADFKYPLWRIEETVRPGLPGQPEVIRSRNIMIADHVMVRLRASTDEAQLKALAASNGLSIRKTMKMPGCYLIGIAGDPLQALPRLLSILAREQPLIRYAEPDYIVRARNTSPNDPSYWQLWGLHNTTVPGADISAPQVWDLTTGGTQVVVAVIDTGIDYQHPDLAPNIWTNVAERLNGIDDDGNGYVDDVRGWNFVSDNNNPMDGHGHGTHCAGTIGAVGNNGVGVVGVNWTCRTMPLKFLNDSGLGADSDAVDALHYVADLRRRGVNIRLTSNSWGGGEYFSALRDAIRENAEADILFISAAGNEGLDIDVFESYPARYGESNMIVVAATDNADGLAYFSNYGATTVHLGAPGVNIYSTHKNAQYATMSGTSMATPHVAGVATLLWNSWPSARGQDIRDAILRGADPIMSLTDKTITGARLNAFNSMRMLFRIVHTPLANTHNTGSDYVIEADIGPQLLLDSNSPTLFWNTDNSTNFTPVPLVSVSNSLYQATIPIQPEGSVVRYWLRATATGDITACSPGEAPTNIWTFTIVPPLSLTVTGAPATFATATPPYGTFNYPSGNVLNASAQETTPTTNGSRWHCTGWTGTGSVPATGTTNVFAFTFSNQSSLCWQWTHESALVHTSSINASLNRTIWWSKAISATSLTAAATTSLSGTTYRFTGWELDGLRQPSPTNTAVNPVVGIPMSTPHQLNAHYLPENEDLNSDGIADWWASLYFGTNAIIPGADDDGDGFSNLIEFQDLTDPRDPSSIPVPPAILHSPLSDPQLHPAPFPISATITDSFKVTSATLHWTRNGGTESNTVMTLGTNNQYTAAIPAPGTNSDTFTYWIVAADALSSSTNGPHRFACAYPIVSITPSSLDTLLLPNSASNRTLCVTNTGGYPLLATLSILWGGYSNDMEQSVADWTHSGVVDQWNWSTNRSYSGLASWYCGNPATRVYGSMMHARLETPPIFLPPDAQLTFNHWIQCELDFQINRPGWLPNNCWDGGIVEISTNNGTSFQQITPVGGYPNLISGYWQSPWPDMTPCYAGTGSWRQAVFNLSAFSNQLAIIRFHFGSDANTEKEGWYIDDVVVSPIVPPQSWLTLPSTNVIVPANQSLACPVATMVSSNIPTGDFHAALVLTGNAPTNPVTRIPVRLRVRSPALLTWLDARQTSTNGTGLITLSNSVSDIDGDSPQIEFQWTSSPDTPWSNAWITAVQSQVGTATFVHAEAPQVSSVVTRSQSGLLTNLVATTWDTSASGTGLSIASNILVRARPWDGYFWGNWATSQPFMVDNEAPSAPRLRSSTTRWIRTWSSDNVIPLSWDASTDGKGVGVKGYRYGSNTNSDFWATSGSTVLRLADTTPPGDGTNIWVWVQAEDACGNLSTPVPSGPYWRDCTPPSPANVSISLVVSPYGNYVMGVNSITGSWSGFTETGTGIAGYYISLQDGGGSPQGTWTTDTRGILSPLVLNQTNTFFVWAQDNIGWIGPAAKASFVALSPNTDWDHDGISNILEDLSGTDATLASSALRLGISAPSPGQFILQWPGLTNRRYTIYYNDSLTNSPWPSLPGGTNIPGLTGTMTHTDEAAIVPARFYRISISAP